MPSDTKMMKEFVRLANRTEGWAAGTTGRRTVFWCPDGSRYYTSATPGGHRAIANTKADLRRRGLPIPR